MRYKCNYDTSLGSAESNSSEGSGEISEPPEGSGILPAGSNHTIDIEEPSDPYQPWYVFHRFLVVNIL